MCVATAISCHRTRHTPHQSAGSHRGTLPCPLRFDPHHEHCLNRFSRDENTPTSRNADRHVGRPPARRCLDVPSASTRRPPGVAITGSPREQCHPGQPRPAGEAIVERGDAERSKARLYRFSPGNGLLPNAVIATPSTTAPIAMCTPVPRRAATPRRCIHRLHRTLSRFRG